MTIVIYTLLVLIGLLALFAISLLVTELRVVNRLVDTNKQLLLFAVGKSEKPEVLRALVASAKPPQGGLKGIANNKKGKNDKSKNTDYTMSIGV